MGRKIKDQICQNCKKNFTNSAYHKTQKYCSAECRLGKQKDLNINIHTTIAQTYYETGRNILHENGGSLTYDNINIKGK